MKLPENQIRYIDLPEISETFVDSFGAMTFDGQTARIELCVQRMDMPTGIPKPDHKPTVRKYTACRLVLTPDALIDLSNNLQNFNFNNSINKARGHKANTAGHRNNSLIKVLSTIVTWNLAFYLLSIPRIHSSLLKLSFGSRNQLLSVENVCAYRISSMCRDQRFNNFQN
jgi:hypothetical protein